MDEVHEAHLERILENRRRRGVAGSYNSNTKRRSTSATQTDPTLLRRIVITADAGTSTTPLLSHDGRSFHGSPVAATPRPEEPSRTAVTPQGGRRSRSGSDDDRIDPRYAQNERRPATNRFGRTGAGDPSHHEGDLRANGRGSPGRQPLRYGARGGGEDITSPIRRRNDGGSSWRDRGGRGTSFNDGSFDATHLSSTGFGNRNEYGRGAYPGRLRDPGDYRGVGTDSRARNDRGMSNSNIFSGGTRGTGNYNPAANTTISSSSGRKIPLLTFGNGSGPNDSQRGRSAQRGRPGDRGASQPQSRWERSGVQQGHGGERARSSDALSKHRGSGGRSGADEQNRHFELSGRANRGRAIDSPVQADRAGRGGRSNSKRRPTSPQRRGWSQESRSDSSEDMYDGGSPAQNSRSMSAPPGRRFVGPDGFFSFMQSRHGRPLGSVVYTGSEPFGPIQPPPGEHHRTGSGSLPHGPRGGSYGGYSTYNLNGIPSAASQARLSPPRSVPHHLQSQQAPSYGLPDTRTTMDLPSSVTILATGDWFYKWNSKGTRVSRRWVWIDPQSYLFVWSRKETYDTAFTGSMKLEKIQQIIPKQMQEIDDDGTPRYFYAMQIINHKRVLQIATELRQKADAWYEALGNVVAFCRRNDGNPLPVFSGE